MISREDQELREWDDRFEQATGERCPIRKDLPGFTVAEAEQGLLAFARAGINWEESQTEGDRPNQ